MKSTHIPEFAGDIVSFTGSTVVDTGLRDVQSFSATLADDADANVAAVSATLNAIVPGTTRTMTLNTWEDDGTTAGSDAANVAWMALGK